MVERGESGWERHGMAGREGSEGLRESLVGAQ